MNKVQKCLIKQQCIMYAAQNEMEIIVLNNETFEARGGGSVLNVPIGFLFDQVQNGWDVQETLQNESCYDESQDETSPDFTEEVA